MRLNVEVYIGTDRLDLFADENIQMNRTVKDFRDLDKVFSDFTQSFTIPASKQNNIAMSHWYNESIATGFNPATKKAARIDINTLPFRSGYIWLKRAVLKNGSVDFYEVEFFSEMTNLTDVFGKDTIPELGTNEELKLRYDTFDDGIQNTTGAGSKFIPLATSSRNWNLQGVGNGIYNSINTKPYTGNIQTELDKRLALIPYDVSIQSDVDGGTVKEIYNSELYYFNQFASASGSDNFIWNMRMAKPVSWSMKFYDVNDGFATVGNIVGTGTSAGFVTVNRSVPPKYIFPAFYDYPNCDWELDISVSMEAGGVVYSAIVKYAYSAQGGLKYELKPAISADTVLTAIESKYSVSFTGGFWASDAWQDLYLWSNRYEGFGDHYNMDYVQITGGTLIGNPNYNTSTGVLNVPANSGQVVVVVGINVLQSLLDAVNDTLPMPKVKLVAYDIDTSAVFETVYFDAGRELGHNFVIPNQGTDRNLKFYVKSNFPELFNWTIASDTSYLNFSVSRAYQEMDTSSTCDFRYFNYAYTDSLTGESLSIDGGLPDQMIIDWLQGIIQMFNLVILPVDGSTFQVETFDDWKALGSNVDITKYVDMDEVNVQPAELYNELKFNFEPTESVIGQNFAQIHAGIGYGDSITKIRDSFGDAISPEKFALKVPFENPSWSRLTNYIPQISDSQFLSQLMVCHYIDKNFTPIGGGTVMFYRGATQNLATVGETEFSFRDFYANEPFGADKYTQYNVCYQYNDKDNTYTQSLNFGAEVNPFTLETDTATSPTIYKSFWEDYITDLYDLSMRRTMLKAILPLHLMLEIKVNDVLTISEKKYTINNMRLNLTTGEAMFELLTLVD